MKYLSFIVARKGSKGIPDKNMKLLNGQPLIQYTFESSIKSKLLSEIHLSTDDEQIIELSKKFGIKSFYTRPALLASDESTVLDVIFYHLNWLESHGYSLPENLILLQPTSPIRNLDLVDNCIDEYELSKKESLIAVSKCLQHPYEMFEIKNKKLHYLNKAPARRQEYPDYYFITGSIYIAKTAYIKKEKKLFDENSAIYVVSSAESIDIDEEKDLALAEFYLTKQLNN
jgi:CMP-N,N'-diacetyllegionaminic acid synthase